MKLCSRLVCSFIASCLLLLCHAPLEAQSIGGEADPIAAARQMDDHTQLLLVPSKAGDHLVDVATDAKVTLKGGRIVKDPSFGHVVQMPDDDSAGIEVHDLTHLNYDKGFTLEAWVWLEELDDAKNQSRKGGMFAYKAGSFALSLGTKNTLDVSWLSFPSIKVATDSPKQFKYFPVSSDGFGGSITIPTGQWSHLAVTYDPDRQIIHTYVDGQLDRARYTRRAYGNNLNTGGKGSLVLFPKASNMRVGPVRVSGIAKPIAPNNPMETYVHQFPYQGDMAVIFTRMKSDLPYPLQANITWETPNGSAHVIQRVTLDSPAEKTIRFTPPGWRNDYYTLIIRVTANYQTIFTRRVQVTNSKAGNRSRYHIDADKTLSIDGKKIFPLMLFHVLPEDYAHARKIGFNVLVPRSLRGRLLGFGRGGAQNLEDLRTSLKAAKDANVLLTVPARIGGITQMSKLTQDQSIAAWYPYDEPWGTLSKLLDSYNAIKLEDRDTPVIIAQNNLTRMHETAEGADVVLCDPYPIPNVSLRTVTEATEAAIEGSAGLKPVWTIVCQYGSKRPNVPELRCMLYLGVAAGAQGLGVYAWDDRLRDFKTNELDDGWYTRNNAEDLATLTTVMKEISSLQDIFIHPNVPVELSLTPENPAIHVAVKKDGDKTWLIIVNDSRAQESAVLDLTSLNATGAQLVTDPAVKLRIVQGKVNLSLAPLQAGVYLLQTSK